MHGTLIVNDTTCLAFVPDRRIVSACTMAMGDKRFSASTIATELLPGNEPNSTRLVFT